MSFSFSSFGKILEKTKPIAVDEVINLNGHILPKIQKDKNKLRMFSLLRRYDGKQNCECYPFNSVSRKAKPTLCCLLPEKSYEAKYTPKFEAIQSKSPSYNFGSKSEFRTRSESLCSQDYYIDEYSSFRRKQKSLRSQSQDQADQCEIQSSTRSQTEKQYISCDSREECPKLQLLQKLKIGKRRRNKSYNLSPDFRKYTDRKYEQREFLQQYDLLNVNYARIYKRCDIGYVEFSKFTDKVVMKQDRAEILPSVRLDYDSSKPKLLRNIYLGNNKPTYPKLKPKLATIIHNAKYLKKSQQLICWLNQ